MKEYFVYILASGPHGTLYIGMTNNLRRRVLEYKHGVVDGFTKKYDAHRLVYYEDYTDVNDAIHREKCLKRWKRGWKIRLINQSNPDWKDLCG